MTLTDPAYLKNQQTGDNIEQAKLLIQINLFPEVTGVGLDKHVRKGLDSLFDIDFFRTYLKDFEPVTPNKLQAFTTELLSKLANGRLVDIQSTGAKELTNQQK